jgi:hypothetical protein
LVSTYGTLSTELFLYLVISLAEELELLGLLVHEDPVQVTSLHRPDLDGLGIREIVEPTNTDNVPCPFHTDRAEQYSVANLGWTRIFFIPNPGSKRFPDQGSGSASKNLSILTQKIVSKLSEILFRIRILLIFISRIPG